MKQFVQDNILLHLIRDEAHDLFHFIEVRNLAIESVKELEDWQKEYVVTAAFLHDIDDKKLQKDGKEGKWVDYVLDSYYINNKDKEIIKTIIT